MEMNLENTPLYNSQYHIVQSIVGEQGFPQDPIAAEDELFYRLGELVDENALTSDEAFEVYASYIESQRPDARIIHLGERVARPFFE